MNTRDIERFKKMLLAEKATLAGEMPTASDSKGGMSFDSADENEVADKIEEFEENAAISTRLTQELTEVDAALERIAQGTYGTCEACGKPIEIERLEANPSARTSLTHGHK